MLLAQAPAGGDQGRAVPQLPAPAAQPDPVGGQRVEGVGEVWAVIAQRHSSKLARPRPIQGRWGNDHAASSCRSSVLLVLSLGGFVLRMHSRRAGRRRRPRPSARSAPPERAATFTFDPGVPAADRDAFLTAVAHARPEAQALIAAVDGLVDVHVAADRGGHRRRHRVGRRPLQRDRQPRHGLAPLRPARHRPDRPARARPRRRLRARAAGRSTAGSTPRSRAATAATARTRAAARARPSASPRASPSGRRATSASTSTWATRSRRPTTSPAGARRWPRWPAPVPDLGRRAPAASPATVRFVWSLAVRDVLSA